MNAATPVEKPAPAKAGTPMVSMVANVRGKEPKPVLAEAAIQAIRAGKYRKAVGGIRQLYAETLAKTGDHKAAKRAVDQLKKKLPAVQFTGVFSGRGDGALDQYSGLLCADLDALTDAQQAEARAKLAADPYVFGYFTSPTGTGLKCVFRVGGDAKQHFENFLAVKQHVQATCGLVVDGSCKNLERLCFVSDDASAYCNPAALPLAPIISTANAHNGEAPKVQPDVLETRRRIAADLLGPICWQSPTEGWIKCPAFSSHTTGTQPNHTRVTLDQVPTVFCFHDSCRSAVQATNHELRSRIAKAEATAPQAADAELAAKYGQPFSFRQDGAIAGLNERFFAASFTRPGTILFEPDERAFYEYEPDSGLWQRVSDDHVREALSARVMEYGRSRDTALETKITTARMGAILQSLRGISEQRGVFEKHDQFIHVANGVIRFPEVGRVVLTEFRVTDHSRNRCPIPFQPDAECPKFLNILLRAALSDDDIDLLQRLAGLYLAGINPAQRLAILDGQAASGKSTIARIMRSLVGPVNCAQLRTDQLLQRFEIFRFVGKTLLLAPDVPGDFLGRPGASALKAIVGGDPLTAEAKGSNHVFTLSGNFNILITSNCRLRVRLDGDASAWGRRLIILRFEKPPPPHRIDNLADKLIDEEGPGILRWALAGFVQARQEIAETGDLLLTPDQKARVETMLSESDSLRRFVREGTRRGEGDVTIAELTEGYFHFCSDREWTPLLARKVESTLRDTFLEIYGITQSHGVRRDGHSQRGWCGIRLRREANEATPTTEFRL